MDLSVFLKSDIFSFFYPQNVLNIFLLSRKFLRIFPEFSHSVQSNEKNKEKTPTVKFPWILI